MSRAVHTLIGDVVASRRLPDRLEGQRRLNQVLGEVTAWMGPVQPLEPTVGDEFQGAFATLGEATLAALLVRLGTLPGVDVRCGLGYGEVSVHDATRRPLLQDGPGWWAAREALEELGPRRRTFYIGPDAGRVNAYLTTRDALVERLSERGWRMLDMALRGGSQQEIAETEGISRAAVSQHFARGIAAVRDAHAMFAREE
jgi:DNA-binding CsgD family transcriptional regulator